MPIQTQTTIGARSSWPLAPSHPRLTEGAVHVWSAELTAIDDGLTELLSEEELARAARLLSDRDRLMWARARGLLRALLGRYLELEPSELRFGAGRHGKPMLLEQASRASLDPRGEGASSPKLAFNLSHSGPLALYAFSTAGEVGIDVESDRRQIDEVALAGRMLAEHEATRLRALTDPAVRRREFLQAWTRYEAELKCAGTGIGAGSPGASGQAPWVRNLELPDGAAGAVACATEPRELCCWAWC